MDRNVPHTWAPGDKITAKRLNEIKQALGTLVSVRAYGAVGDGVTDDTAAVQAAVAACDEGDMVYFPTGRYVITKTIFLTRNQGLQGVHTARWSYDGGNPSSLVVGDNFDGVALVAILDKEEGNLPFEPDGIRLYDLSLEGGFKKNKDGAVLAGFRASGQTRDFRALNVSISQFSGNGFHVLGYKRRDANGQNTAYIHAKGFTLQRVAVWQCQNNGFSFNDLTDGVYEDCLAVANYANGFFITGSGENQFFLCRAVFNGAAGFVYTGDHTGGIFTCCTTDRNGSHGFLHSATGTQPLVFNGLIARRDGSKADKKYAGLAVIGASTTALASPCWVNSFTSAPGVDDPVNGVAGGAESPNYGIIAQNYRFLSVSGMPWGVEDSIMDYGGGVEPLQIAPTTYHAKGGVAAPIRWVEPTVSILQRGAPSLQLGPLNGTTPPAPSLATGSDSRRGTILFGSGTAPAAGTQVLVTFAKALPVIPTVLLGSTTAGSASRQPYATDITTTGFILRFNVAPTASQASGTYGVSYEILQ